MPRNGLDFLKKHLPSGILIVAATLLALPAIASADAPTTLEWLADMEAYFEANPELKETRSKALQIHMVIALTHLGGTAGIQPLIVDVGVWVSPWAHRVKTVINGSLE